MARRRSSARRRAQTLHLSLPPDEIADLEVMEELTGVPFPEIYRRHFAWRIRTAATLLREAQESGVQLDRTALRDIWAVHMTSDELASVYTAASELHGD